ncbi:MAG: PEGA domain-containing protein, partial [Armatimonadota bacterium]
PAGAQVYVNGTLMGTTPISLKLQKQKTYTIEFKKEGYHTRTVQLTNSVGAGWIVLDVLGGLIPVIIDAATGSWYSLDQDNVNAVLERQQK